MEYCGVELNEANIITDGANLNKILMYYYDKLAHDNPNVLGRYDVINGRKIISVRQHQYSNYITALLLYYALDDDCNGNIEILNDNKLFDFSRDDSFFALRLLMPRNAIDYVINHEKQDFNHLANLFNVSKDMFVERLKQTHWLPR